MAALKQYYKEKVIPELIKKFQYGNVMQVPKLEKVVLNMGVGEGTKDIKILEAAEGELSLIAGQKVKRTRAKKPISAFKIRAGMPLGCCVTLRGDRMYEFLERFINVAVPRIRDFRGIRPNSFDGRGNFSTSIKEHLIFMELDYSKVTELRGMNITAVTSAKTDQEAFELLKLIGIPFRDK